MKIIVAAMATALLALCGLAAQAQVPVYGASVNLEQAKKVVAAAQVEAKKNSWPVAIAVVDNAGMLVAYERMDNTQTGSVQASIDKAVSAAMYRRSTKAFQDVVAGGGAGLRIARPARGRLRSRADCRWSWMARSSALSASRESTPTRTGWSPRPERTCSSE